MSQTQPSIKPIFIVVYGAPKTGTSLCMDIVQAAGYNPGECYRPPRNPRRGRHEHSMFGQSVGNWARHRVWEIIDNEKITCAKIVGFHTWIRRLNERYNVKILAPNRNTSDREKSALDMLRHLPLKNQKLNAQNGILNTRNNVLRFYEGNYIFVDFDKLITKDKNEFTKLSEFLEFDGNLDVLIGCVDSDRVKFKRGEDGKT